MLHGVCASTPIVLALFVAVEASAVLPQRTFVASYGNDGWPCSLPQPCRGFQAAINAVAPGGEVVAIDSAGYGTMEIHKSVSVIVPPGVHAGLSPSTGIPLPGLPGESTVVLIDIQSTDTVNLRGLNVNQQGTVTGGIHWLSANGGTVHVENAIVNGFTNAGLLMSAPNGKMFVKDSIFRNNGYGIFQGGIPERSYLYADHVRIENSSYSGFYTSVSGRATISDCVISDNTKGISAFSSAVLEVQLHVNRCVFSQRVGFHFELDGTNTSYVVVAASTFDRMPDVARLGTGLKAMYSLGNNAVFSVFNNFDVTYPLQ